MKETEGTVEHLTSSSSSSSSEEGGAEYEANCNQRLGGGEQMDVEDDFDNFGNAPEQTTGHGFRAAFAGAQPLHASGLN